MRGWSGKRSALRAEDHRLARAGENTVFHGDGTAVDEVFIHAVGGVHAHIGGFRLGGEYAHKALTRASALKEREVVRIVRVGEEPVGAAKLLLDRVQTAQQSAQIMTGAAVDGVEVKKAGQAFFSLSVTGSGMIVYGAYLSKDEDVVDVAQHTALFDTIAAVVAALVIIPACFSYGLDVGAGPSLLFVTLPTILQDIPLGRLFAIILYVAMIFAGVSSLQNMFEAVAESLMHKFPRLSRTAVLVILCVVCLGFGIGMETIDKWGPWMDLVSIYIIPIGATLGAISWFYVMKKDELLDAVNTGSGKLRGNLWYSVGRYVYVPLAVILCCVALFMHVAF